MKKLLIILLFILPLSTLAQWGSDIYQSKLGSCNSLLRNVSAGSQELGVLVTSNGGGVIKRYGMLYSTLYTEPTFPTFYTGSTSVSYYNGELNTFYTTYSFSSQTVYTRGFVETDAGIAYGEVIGFTAPSSCSAPQVTLATATNITGTTATSGGNVTNGGTSQVTARGVCWDTEGNPHIPYNYTSDGTGTGSFTSSITGLSAGVTYFYRAYATNACGTSYSELAQFTTTSSHTVPTLITNVITSIGINSATSGGNTLTDGNSTIIEKGVCWNTTGTPTYNNSKTNEGPGAANFTSSIAGLTANTTYYVRAYARSRYDSGGFYIYATGYGQEEVFTTSGGGTLATISTNAISSITTNSATSGGNVTNDGGTTVSARGVCWSTSTNPTTANSHTTDGSGIGAFSSSITGLTCGTTYYVRAYATNNSGTAYGNNVSFTTGTVSYPIVSLWYAINTSTCGYTGNFTSNLSDAQIACQDFKDLMDGICNLSAAGQDYKGSSLSVGVQLYEYNQCNAVIMTGYFITNPFSSNRAITYVANGIIQSITPCP